MIYDLNDVPGYVPSVAHIRNHVQVVGGSNWDLGRTARETPITKMSDSIVSLGKNGAACDCYVPKTSNMNFQPDLIFEFNKNSTTLSKAAISRLKQLPKTISVVVGHADYNERNYKELSKQRAAVITRILKSQGKTVLKAKINANDIPPDDTHNRRVEIFTE